MACLFCQTNNAFCPVPTKTISLQKVISLSEKLNFSLIFPHLSTCPHFQNVIV